MEFIFETLAALRAYGPLIMICVFAGIFLTVNLYDKRAPAWANIAWWGVVAGGFVGFMIWAVLSALLGPLGIPL